MIDEKKRKEILTRETGVTLYTTLGAIAKAWGHEPHEWGLEDDTDPKEVVRFTLNGPNQWLLEREDARGIWDYCLLDFIDNDGVFAVTPDWMEFT